MERRPRLFRALELRAALHRHHIAGVPAQAPVVEEPRTISASDPAFSALLAMT